jgi:hypothetical protein
MTLMTVSVHGVKAAGRVAFVDDEDYELVSPYRWYLKQTRGNIYAQANIRRSDGTGYTTIKMHCLIMGRSGIDHHNGNGLDNQRSNLRSATPGQNNANSRPRLNCTSPYKGVYWNADRGKWQAQISVGGHNTNLGRFATEEKAARAYDAAALAAWGEYARLNFPLTGKEPA